MHDIKIWGLVILGTYALLSSWLMINFWIRLRKLEDWANEPEEEILTKQALATSSKPAYTKALGTSRSPGESKSKTTASFDARTRPPAPGRVPRPRQS